MASNYTLGKIHESYQKGLELVAIKGEQPPPVGGGPLKPASEPHWQEWEGSKEAGRGGGWGLPAVGVIFFFPPPRRFFLHAGSLWSRSGK